jgi:hypothetical protein
LAPIEARIKGLGDEILNSKFHEFSLLRAKISTPVSKGQADEAYQVLIKAISLESEILEMLFKKLRQIQT